MKYKIKKPKYEIRKTTSLRINPDVINDSRLDPKSVKIVNEAIKSRRDIPIYYITGKVRVDNLSPQNYEFVYTTIPVGVWSTSKERGIIFANKQLKNRIKQFKR